MQRYEKIAAISFLSIFSMYMLHQVLPHVHHDHESAEHASLSQSDHSHEGDHHHSDEDDNEGFDFFGLLLGSHAHSVQADNMLVAEQQSTLRTLTVAVITQLEGLVNSICYQEEQVLWRDPPDLTNFPYIASGYQRGPPSLG